MGSASDQYDEYVAKSKTKAQPTNKPSASDEYDAQVAKRAPQHVTTKRITTTNGTPVGTPVVTVKNPFAPKPNPLMKPAHTLFPFAGRETPAEALGGMVAKAKITRELGAKDAKRKREQGDVVPLRVPDLRKPMPEVARRTGFADPMSGKMILPADEENATTPAAFQSAYRLRRAWENSLTAQANGDVVPTGTVRDFFPPDAGRPSPDANIMGALANLVGMKGVTPTTPVGKLRQQVARGATQFVQAEGGMQENPYTVASGTQTAARYPLDPNYEQAMGNGAGAFMRQATSDATFIPQLLANSLASYLPGLANTAAGALALGPIGEAVGAGASSLQLEVGSKIVEALGAAGVDLSNPEAVRDAFADDELMQAARADAWKKGIPVALFDAATAGVAGRFAKAATKAGAGTLRRVGATALDAGIGVVGGTAGEALGQVIERGGVYDIAGVLAEGIAEVPQSLVETGLGAMRGDGANVRQNVRPNLSTPAVPTSPRVQLPRLDATVPVATQVATPVTTKSTPPAEAFVPGRVKVTGEVQSVGRESELVGAAQPVAANQSRVSRAKARSTETEGAPATADDVMRTIDGALGQITDMKQQMKEQSLSGTSISRAEKRWVAQLEAGDGSAVTNDTPVGTRVRFVNPFGDDKEYTITGWQQMQWGGKDIGIVPVLSDGTYDIPLSHIAREDGTFANLVDITSASPRADEVAGEAQAIAKQPVVSEHPVPPVVPPVDTTVGTTETPSIDDNSTSLIQQFKRSKYADALDEARAIRTAQAIAKLDGKDAVELPYTAEALQYEISGGVKAALDSGVWDDGKPIGIPQRDRLVKIAKAMGELPEDYAIEMTRDEWKSAMKEWYPHGTDEQIEREVGKWAAMNSGRIVDTPPVAPVTTQPVTAKQPVITTKVSYEYENPSPAGPFKGTMEVDGTVAKGDTIAAPLGRAVVTRAKTTTVEPLNPSSEPVATLGKQASRMEMGRKVGYRNVFVESDGTIQAMYEMPTRGEDGKAIPTKRLQQMALERYAGEKNSAPAGEQAGLFEDVAPVTADAEPTKLVIAADKLKEASDSLFEDIARDLGRLNAGLDPVLLGKVAAYGAMKIAEGTLRFADFSAHMIERFGEKIQPHVQEIWEKAKAIAKASETDDGDATIDGADIFRESMQRAGAFPTSIKNAVVDAEREMRGLEAMPPVERKAFQESMDAAERRMSDDPTYVGRLVDELVNEPRAINDEEGAALLRHRVQKTSEYGKASDALSKAREAGDLAAESDAKARLDAISNDLSLLEQATGRGGASTETARGLAARRMMAQEDFSLATLEMQKRQDNGWRELTNDEREALQRTADKYKAALEALQKHVDGMETRTSDSESERVVQQLIRDGNKPQAKRAAKTKTDEQRTAQRDATKKRLKAALDAEEQDTAAIGTFIQQLARQHVENGVRERNALIDAVHADVQALAPDMTRRQVMDAISGYGVYRQLSKDEVSVALRDLKGQMQQIGKLEDMEAGNAPKKTGVERRSPSDEERRLTQLVEEAKRKGGYKVTDPATQLASALQARKTYYRNRLADMQHEIAMKARVVKDKTIPLSDAELDAMKAEYQLVKAEHDAMFKTGLTDAQRAKLALAAAERSLTAWQQRLANAKRGVFGVPKKAGVTSPEIEAVRAQVDAVRAEVEELRALANPKKTPAEIALQAYKSRTLRKIAELTDQQMRGDFAPKPRRELTLDAEGIELQAKLDRVKRDWNEARFNDTLKNRTPLQKVFGAAHETINAARAILTSLDFSAVFRQGGFITLSRPGRAIRALPAMFRAFASKGAADRELAEIQSRPNYHLYKSSKLYLSEHPTSLSQMEEAYMSRWADHIPLVAGSQRAYLTFLNRLRADSFDAMVNAFSRNGAVSKEEARAIANYVNVATGRGTLGASENAAVALNTVFFAPRLVASRFQVLMGQPLWKGNARTRMYIAGEYGRYLLGIGVVYALGLAAGAEVEKDPRSSDFGKLRFGNTRIDVLSGLQQVSVLLSRIVSGETKTLHGRTVPIRGERVPYGATTTPDTIGRFLRTKLSPPIASAMDIATGENVVGEKVTPVSVVTRNLIPLAVSDIAQTMQEQGVPRGTVMALLSLLGMGVQTYDTR